MSDFVDPGSYPLIACTNAKTTPSRRRNERAGNGTRVPFTLHRPEIDSYPIDLVDLGREREAQGVDTVTSVLLRIQRDPVSRLLPVLEVGRCVRHLPARQEHPCGNRLLDLGLDPD